MFSRTVENRCDLR